MRIIRIGFFIICTLIMLNVGSANVGAYGTSSDPDQARGQFNWLSNSSSSYGGNGGGPYSWSNSPQYPNNRYDMNSSVISWDGYEAWYIEWYSSLQGPGSYYSNTGTRNSYQKWAKVYYQKKLSSISVSASPSSNAIAYTTTTKITVTAHYQDGSTADVTRHCQWSTDKSSVAYVNDNTNGNVVAGNTIGSAKITAYYRWDYAPSRKSASITINTVVPDSSEPESSAPAKPTIYKETEKSDGKLEVTLKSADGGKIYYRVDGKDPKSYNSDYIFSGDTVLVNVEDDDVLRARVYKNSKWSDLLSEDFDDYKNNKPAKPTIYKETEKSDGKLEVTLKSADGGRIYYRVDGKDPKSTSSDYILSGKTVLVDVEDDDVLRARVYKNSQWSDLLSEDFEDYKNRKPAKPTIDDENDKGNGIVEVELGSKDGGKIYYTLDGTTPNTNDENIVSGNTVDINVEDDDVLRARVYKNSQWSDLLSEDFEDYKNCKPAKPTIYNKTEKSDGKLEVTLKSADGGRIYYRVDGKDPQSNNSDYILSGNTVLVDVDDDDVLRARVYKNSQWSDLLSEDFEDYKNCKPAKPTIDDENDKSNGIVEVELGSKDGGKIYYTLDETTPNTDDDYITSGDTVDVDVEDGDVLKARVYKNSQWSDLLEEDFEDYDSNRPAKPTIEDENEKSNGILEIELGSKDGGRIYYRLDGKDPEDVNSDYVMDGDTIDVDVEDGDILNARVYKNSKWSDLLEEDFDDSDSDDNDSDTTVRFSKASGTYDETITVRVYCENEDAKIYYTINGKDPKIDKNEYLYDGDKLDVSKDSVILARAYYNRTWGEIAAVSYKFGTGSSDPSIAALEDEEEDLLMIARELYADEEYDDSLEVLEQLLSIYEDSEEGIVLLADCYIAKGQKTTAYNRLKDFTSTYEEKPLAVNKFAEVCISSGKASEAKKVLLEIMPQYPRETYLSKTFTYAQDELNQININVFVYGNEVQFSTYDYIYPQIVNGRTLVPIRAITEAMGADVEWDSSARRATIGLDGDEIVLVDGSTTAKVNGRSVTLDVPAQIFGTRLMVPLRFVSENLGRTVDWYEVEKGRTVTVNEVKEF